MAGQTEKQKRTYRTAVKAVIAVTAVLTLVLAVLFLRLREKNRIEEQKLSDISESMSEAEAEAEELKEKSDGKLTVEEIIEIARERFKLVFPDEILFIPKKNGK